MADKNGRSVIQEPPPGGLLPASDYIIQFATLADGFPMWGLVRQRDRLLREFWPKEPILAGALFTTIAKYTAFGWHLVGPPRTAARVQDMLQHVERGAGWSVFCSKVLLDLFTQDNGAFIELVRMKDSPESPVVSMNHLDSGRCWRTGRKDYPVIYQDITGAFHKMLPHNVLTITEFPSPIELFRGIQYCALSRMLSASQLIRDITQYRREKVSGRFNKVIHIIGGVQNKLLQDAIAQQQQKADDMGLFRYMPALIVAGLDPDKRVSKETIELASLPEDFDLETEFKLYINTIANAFGGDYQDYAPLPGGNLGTAQQSQVLLTKSRGKGPRLFIQLFEHLMNFAGVIPRNVTFKFGEQDIEQDIQVAELRRIQALTVEIMGRSGAINPQIQRQILLDLGILREEYLAMLAEENATDERPYPSSIPIDPDPEMPPPLPEDQRNPPQEDIKKVPFNQGRTT